MEIFTMIAHHGMEMNSGYVPNAATRETARRGLLRTISAWFDRTRRRADLPLLDERMLRDIGVTPDWLDHETTKPFWVE
jgi:uncharacterized protein YjiS (DUF1127 family)